MKKILTALVLVTILASCQKEIAFDDGNPGNTGGNGTGNGNGSTDGMLWKSVAVTGAETQTTIYKYDSQKRLASLKTTGVGGTIPLDNYVEYIRDATGRVIKVRQKMADPAPGIIADTAVNTYHYPDATTMNFDYSVNVMRVDMGGGFAMETIDSAVYNYTAGKLTSFDSYLSSNIVPGTSNSRTEFTYDGSGKVSGMKMFNDQGTGTMALIADYKYTYASTSVNGIYTTASAAQNLIINGLPNTGTNVTTKMEMVSNATAPPMTLVMTTTYVNGAGNKPLSSTVITTETGQPTQTSKFTFHYQ